MNLPKPEPRGPKPPKRIGRTAKIRRSPARGPRIRAPRALGDYRARVKYANELWRHLVYLKEPSKVCPRCMKREWHDAAHCFIKGRYVQIRFDLSNGAPLCRFCHRQVDNDHHAKEEFFRRYIGDVEYERLRLRAMSRSKDNLALTILFLQQETQKAKGVA